mmetsp:Transcript_32299/g.47489  ORF Transcript_32299/g.47489 Transcript_32299/m.47489 type:complete len:108 (+) Transcript_32299:651-974(+)
MMAKPEHKMLRVLAWVIICLPHEHVWKSCCEEAVLFRKHTYGNAEMEGEGMEYAQTLHILLVVEKLCAFVTRNITVDEMTCINHMSLLQLFFLVLKAHNFSATCKSL